MVHLDEIAVLYDRTTDLAGRLKYCVNDLDYEIPLEHQRDDLD